MVKLPSHKLELGSHPFGFQLWSFLFQLSFVLILLLSLLTLFLFSQFRFFFLLVFTLLPSPAIHFLFPRFPFSSPPFQSLLVRFLSLVLPLVIAVKMNYLPIIIRLLLLPYVTQVETINKI